MEENLNIFFKNLLINLKNMYKDREDLNNVIGQFELRDRFVFNKNIVFLNL